MQLKNNWISKTPETRLYQLPVPIIGLTGGIACGKSTVAKILSEKGFAIIDADQLVKRIYRQDETKAFITKEFPVCINEQQEIDFKKLRTIVFSDSQKKLIIEQFIYQRMPAQFLKAYEELPNHLKNAFVFYDVPLLFEKGLDSKVDVSICVWIPRSKQIERLMKRDEISYQMAENILNEQIDIDIKKEKADLVLDNSQTPNQLVDEINQCLSQLIVSHP